MAEVGESKRLSSISSSFNPAGFLADVIVNLASPLDPPLALSIIGMVAIPAWLIIPAKDEDLL